MKFVKMHGCGNDYVYLDGVTDAAIARRIDEPGWVELVKAMSDRHKGIGSDGVIVLCPPTGSGKSAGAQVRMRMFNADGSESEMCGNGVRCVAKFAHDRLGVRCGGGNPMLVETGRGVLNITCEVVGGKVVAATVDMGEPILDLERIPADPTLLKPGGGPHEHRIDAHQFWYDAVLVSMGNPHAVIFELSRKTVGNRLRQTFASEAQRAAYNDIETIGPAIEFHPAFQQRINAHFVSFEPGAGPAPEATMRTWERGTGVTMACGTGACAVVVAGVLTGRLQRRAMMHLPGGDLMIHWDERSNHVFMTGPAEDVCEGVWLGGD